LEENKVLQLEGNKELPIIILNRLEGDNKLSIDFMDELTSKINMLIQDGARAIIVTNKGEYFCGGGELGDYREKSSIEIDKFGESFIELHRTITYSKVPMIAAIDGIVMGGGFSLVEAFDFAFASPKSVFSVPEIKFGLAPMMALTGVKKLLSKKKCYEMVLLGREINALKAEEIGLINKACQRADVMKTSIAIGEELRGYNPTALNLCKRLYNTTEKMAYEEQLNNGLMYLISLLKSRDAEEAKSSKTPIWQNK